MMKNTILLITVLAVGLVPCTDLHASALDCPGGIVSVGDSRVDLLAKCGEPASKETHQEEIIERPAPGSWQKILLTVDEWTYDFGPSKLTRIVTLKNGRISDIATGGYGYLKSAAPGVQECSEHVVSVGERTSDVIAKCGEPTWKDTRQEEQILRAEPGQAQKTVVTIEEWTYDLGPNRFVRVLTFRNGTLTDIRTGGYGYELRQKERKKAP